MKRLVLEAKSQHSDSEGLFVDQIYRQMIRHSELSGHLKSKNCCSLQWLQALCVITQDRHSCRLFFTAATRNSRVNTGATDDTN